MSSSSLYALRFTFKKINPINSINSTNAINANDATNSKNSINSMNPTNTTTMNKESYNFMDVPKAPVNLRPTAQNVPPGCHPLVFWYNEPRDSI
jgi:hypothetical protein